MNQSSTITQLKQQLAEKTLKLVTEYSNRNNIDVQNLREEIKTLAMVIPIIDEQQKKHLRNY